MNINQVYIYSLRESNGNKIRDIWEYLKKKPEKDITFWRMGSESGIVSYYE